MLKLEVAIPASSMDFDFDFNEARPMPFLSAPSTPRRFDALSLSAPTSPSSVAEFYRRNDDEERSCGIPFNWEERPGTPKSPKAASKTLIEDDFAFDFSSELEKASLPADQLFDGGKIRPLKPPPGLQLGDSMDRRSPLRSPRAKAKKMFSQVFSPRRKKLDSDPFEIAAENTRKRAENERGRERTTGLTTSSSRRATRSLSPFRVVQSSWQEEEEEEERKKQFNQNQAVKLNQNSSMSSNSSSSSSSTSKSSSKKWSFRDFLLFRSASEGRASDKDRFRKYYPALFRKHEEVKNTSFRSADGDSGSWRKGRVSAHELHYKTNKAVSEDLKKKTFLPYKQGILGRFAFNPTVHALR